MYNTKAGEISENVQLNYKNNVDIMRIGLRVDNYSLYTVFCDLYVVFVESYRKNRGKRDELKYRLCTI